VPIEEIFTVKLPSVPRVFRLLALSISVMPALGLAQTGYQVDISSLVNTDLTTYTNGGDYPQNGGPLTINGVPFVLATSGPNNDTSIIQTTGSADDSYTIPVNLSGITTIYTLINSAYGACGTTVGEVDITGVASGTVVYSLTEGTNIRDHNQSGFCNTATDLAGTANFGGGQVRLDMQEIDLPASFATDTITNVVFEGYGLGNSGEPFMAGMTAATGSLLTAPLQFVAMTPCRVIDTRGPAGAFGAPELIGGQIAAFYPPQSTNCNIPATAVAYSINVTVVPDAMLAYLTLWPDGQPQPNVSILNSDGRVKANAAITPAGANGGIDFYASDNTQLIVDIDGYFEPVGTASALAFYPVTPCRIADTRGASGPFGGPFLSGGSSRDFPILSSPNCTIPSTAQAYSLNVTAVPHATLNYLTIWPSDQPQPYVSTLNSSTGAVAANAAVVPAAADGDVSVFVSDDADVILDVNGYFAPAATGGLSLYTTVPCRGLDTRSNGGAISGATSFNESSACSVPSAAQAFVLNATVVPVGTLNYLTLWPDGQAQPNVSTLNADDGAITSNMAIVPTTNGSIDIFTSDPSQVILDLSSYFAP
jgi:hypothetical protein